jgi:hypothetical protein
MCSFSLFQGHISQYMKDQSSLGSEGPVPHVFISWSTRGNHSKLTMCYINMIICNSLFVIRYSLFVIVLFQMYYKASLGNPFTCSQDSPPPPSSTLENYVPGVHRRVGQYFLQGNGREPARIGLGKTFV